MTQYIDKAALVAEIERLRKNQKLDDRHNQGVLDGLHAIEKFINTYEVKGADLEKVFNDEYSKFSNDPDAMDYAFPIDLSDYKDFAKHFFDLGLKASQNDEVQKI